MQGEEKALGTTRFSYRCGLETICREGIAIQECTKDVYDKNWPYFLA